MATARGSDVAPRLAVAKRPVRTPALAELDERSIERDFGVFSPVNATWNFSRPGRCAGALLDLHSQLFESVARPCMRSEARERTIMDKGLWCFACVMRARGRSLGRSAAAASRRSPRRVGEQAELPRSETSGRVGRQPRRIGRCHLLCSPPCPPWLRKLTASAIGLGTELIAGVAPRPSGGLLDAPLLPRCLTSRPLEDASSPP